MAGKQLEQYVRTGTIRAQEVRGSLGLGRGPVPNMFSLVESEGIFLVRAPSGSPDLHAFFAMIDGSPVIYVNSGETLGRQTFSVAHEYYHFLFDRQSLREVDCNPGSKTKNPREVAADAFAGEFLLPRDGVAYEYVRRFGTTKPGEREAIKMMQVFRVSYRAMVKALRKADLFDSYSAYKRVKDICSLENKDKLRELTLRLGFSTELIDPTSTPQCPQRFLEAVIANYESGLITYRKLRSLLEPWKKTPEEYGLSEDRTM